MLLAKAMDRKDCHNECVRILYCFTEVYNSCTLCSLTLHGQLKTLLNNIFNLLEYYVLLKEKKGREKEEGKREKKRKETLVFMHPRE